MGIALDSPEDENSFPGGAVVKNLPANIGDAGDTGSGPGSGRSPGKGNCNPLYNILREGNGNPLQGFCLDNPRNGGAWWAAVCGVTQSQRQLK